MKTLRSTLSWILLLWLPLRGAAQYSPLPRFQPTRRADTRYMDSLAQLAKQHYAFLATQPTTLISDTLRFRYLYYLGDLYRNWSIRRDSTVFFGQELIKQARLRRNIFFEANGKLLLEAYYRAYRRNTPEALRLNFELLQLLPNTTFYEVSRFRVLMNLGDLHSIAKDYPAALQYLRQAQQVVQHNLIYAGAETSLIFRVEVEQHLGALYMQQGNFPESNAHYLAADSLLTGYPSESMRGYIYDDLAEFHLKFSQFGQALLYARKAEAIWNRIRPPTESKSWGTLACVFAGLGQYGQAQAYAQKVLSLPKPTKFVQEQAYSALYLVAEHRQNWRDAAFYFRKYIAIRDTIIADQRSLELASIRNQHDYELLNMQHQQARQLQAQQLLTLQQQAEIDRLKAITQAVSLNRKARLSEQRRLLDNERARNALNQQRIAQQLREQALRQQQLIFKTHTQHWQLRLFTSLLLLLTSFVALLLYALHLRKRNAEADRLLAHERQESDARIIQTQEEERQRLATDLHDDLGGTLATLSRRIHDFRQDLHEPAQLSSFAMLQTLLQKSNEDLRRIAHNLMPPEFTRVGLCHALNQLVSIQPAFPTQFSFVMTGNEHRLSIPVELNAYRIVSELVHNVQKHAHARRTAVQLLYNEFGLTITVEDDGLGSQAIPVESAGIGLKNCTLRAEYIGATLWREVSEAGTLVVLDIPYQPTNSRANRTSSPHSDH